MNIVKRRIIDGIQLSFGLINVKIGDDGDLNNLFSILFNNLKGYDIAIIAIGFLEAIIVYLLFRTVNRIKSVENDDNEKKQKEFVLLNMLFSFFTVIKDSFPFLGIFGTVLSYYNYYCNPINSIQYFLSALTSTFWGLLFSIIYRIINGFLAYKVELIQKRLM